jgi:hypothetical protein
MSITMTLGLIGSLLAAIHLVVSLPAVIWASSVSAISNPHKAHIWSGLAVYLCWGIYGVTSSNYLLAFAMLLGVLKYTVVIVPVYFQRLPSHTSNRYH